MMRLVIRPAALGLAATFGLAALPPLQALPRAYQPAMPAVAPAAPGLTAGSPEPDAYILGPGDQLQLSFLAPAFSSLGGSFTLLNDGSTNLPQLGSVVLEGLTIGQAEAWLRQLYARSMRRPDLTLRVNQPRPMQVSVIGEVENPGIYLLSPGGEGSAVVGASGGSIPGLPTVVSAIQKAGGITLNANLGDIRLQRRLPGDTAQLKETSLSLLALLQKGDKRQNPFLFDGDTIVVSRAPAPPPDEVLEIASANLSPQQIQVSMVGEVKSPGSLGLRAGTPLMQAILRAGGPDRVRANKNNIELIRLFRNGTVALRRYTYDPSLPVSGDRNPPLRDGDTIVVNRSGFARTVDTLDAVSQPITSLVGLVGIFSIIQNWNNNNNN
jgi:polysaccharide export outer membrane protein